MQYLLKGFKKSNFLKNKSLTVVVLKEKMAISVIVYTRLSEICSDQA